MNGPDEVMVDGIRYVRAYPVAKGRCPHCGAQWHEWPAKRVLEALRRWHDRHGYPPRYDQFRRQRKSLPVSRYVFEMFGGWTRAQLAAGLEPTKRGGKLVWTRERIIEALQAYGRAHAGRPPTSSEWAQSTPGTPCSRTVAQRFGGSWNAALEAAGFFPRGPYGHRLRPPVDQAPFARELVDAAPIADAVRDYLGGGGTLRDIADLASVDESYLGKVVGGSRTRVNLEFADRVLCAISRPDLLAGVAA